MVINPIVGVYIPIIRIPIKGGMTIPNIATFDHATYGYCNLVKLDTSKMVTLALLTLDDLPPAVAEGCVEWRYQWISKVPNYKAEPRR